MNSDGKYYYAKSGSSVFLKLTGTLKYTISSKFDTFLDRLLTDNAGFEDVLVDLSEAKYLDSTNLGFLARISEYMSDRYSKKVTLLSPDPEINATLESVGFDEVFNLVRDEKSIETDLKEITPDEKAERKKAVMMLEAHRALMKVSEKNAEKFRDVIELLEKSVNPERDEKSGQNKSQ